MRRLASDSEIDDETVGFHAQQAIERWIKAVMVFHGLEEIRIHDLGRLLELLRDTGVELPPDADRVDELTIRSTPFQCATTSCSMPSRWSATLRLCWLRKWGNGRPLNSAEKPDQS
jgi:hypothetical protein